MLWVCGVPAAMWRGVAPSMVLSRMYFGPSFEISHFIVRKYCYAKNLKFHSTSKINSFLGFL